MPPVDQMQQSQLDHFIGPRYVVTVHGPVNPAVPPEASLRETRAVLGRIEGGRLRPRSAFELSYVIVSALAQGQEAFVERVTRQVWPLEQRVTSGHLGDPEQFLEELFCQPPGRSQLVGVRIVAMLLPSSLGVR
jgi:magnesium transporter